jgi:hypothetical protein
VCFASLIARSEEQTIELVPGGAAVIAAVGGPHPLRVVERWSGLPEVSF